jgi:phosphoglucomutase
MIKFGTSGWRAVMGEEFTFHNVRLVVQAIINYLKKKYPEQKVAVVVNYDTRFLSDRFAFEAAKILSHNMIHVYLSDRDAPSQAQALQVIQRKAQAGINFTASFNPPEYNGLKFNTETGAPAFTEVTEKIEKELNQLTKKYSFCPLYPSEEFIEKIDLQHDYLAFIQNKINFELIKKSGIKVAVDPLYGTSREYLDEILEENEIPVEEIHGYIDPYFGGVAPSCSEENLKELETLVKEKHCQIGIATDADGDRFGILDENGHFVIQNLIVSLVLDYLVSEKKWRGGVARSVATTHLVDRIARKYDLPLFRVPVGFKYIADLFLKNKIIFGAEESACMAIKDHLPEKDGIFAGLLVVEMMAAMRKPLTELVADLFRKYGKRVGKQQNIPLNAMRGKKLANLKQDPPAKLGKRDILSFKTIDGIKLNLAEDDWVLLRPSGTEPLIRCYAEASTEKEVRVMMNDCLNLLG